MNKKPTEQSFNQEIHDLRRKLIGINQHVHKNGTTEKNPEYVEIIQNIYAIRKKLKSIRKESKPNLFPTSASGAWRVYGW